MCRIGRQHSSGCAPGAFVVAVLGGVFGFAQEEKPRPMAAPPPAMRRLLDRMTRLVRCDA